MIMIIMLDLVDVVDEENELAFALLALPALQLTMEVVDDEVVQKRQIHIEVTDINEYLYLDTLLLVVIALLEVTVNMLALFEE